MGFGPEEPTTRSDCRSKGHTIHKGAVRPPPLPGYVPEACLEMNDCLAVPYRLMDLIFESAQTGEQ